MRENDNFALVYYGPPDGRIFTRHNNERKTCSECRRRLSYPLPPLGRWDYQARYPDTSEMGFAQRHDVRPRCHLYEATATHSVTYYFLSLLTERPLLPLSASTTRERATLAAGPADVRV